MSKFKREFGRYLVFKMKDVDTVLSEDEIAMLAGIATKLHRYRLQKYKKSLECVVVESDWPEYEKVWDMIEERCSE